MFRLLQLIAGSVRAVSTRPPEGEADDGAGPVPRRRRRTALTFTGVVAAFLLATTAAWACIPWVGKMTVTTPPGQKNVTVHGNGSFMQWCDNKEPVHPAEANSGDVVTISVERSNACNTQLPAEDFVVTFSSHTFQDTSPQDGKYNDQEWDGTNDCHLQGVNPNKKVMERVDGDTNLLRVDENGEGSGQYRIPADASSSGPQEAAAICLSSIRPPFSGAAGDPPEGNMAPITIL